MALQRGLESCRPPATRLFCDPFARELVSRRWRVALSAARLEPVRRLIEGVYDHIGGPGPRASAVARTRLIDDAILDALESVAQVVILGAGFDSRAHRLPGLGERAIFEVDHPATQATKRERLQRVKTPRPATVELVPVDFDRDDLVRALHGAGYADGSASLFLWEGVTNYLTDDAVDRTLGAIRSLSSPRSTLVFTYVDRAALQGAGDAFPEAARWLAAVSRRGEPWTFGLDPGSVGAYLADRGFQLTGDLSTEAAGERYFAPRGRREQASRLYHVVTATRI
jgi:methyltransferase (TIGR00027 family)